MIRMSLHLSGVTPATHWPVKTSGHVTLSQGAHVSPRHVTQVRVTRRSLVSSPMMAQVTSGHLTRREWGWDWGRLGGEA